MDVQVGSTHILVVRAGLDHCRYGLSQPTFKSSSVGVFKKKGLINLGFCVIEQIIWVEKIIAESKVRVKRVIESGGDASEQNHTSDGKEKNKEIEKMLICCLKTYSN